MTEQTISPAGIGFLAAREAVMLRAYPDATGTWTIGIGHTAAAGPPDPAAGMCISAEAAHALLAADLARIYEPTLHRAVTVALEQHEFDALDSLVYNIGGGNFAGSTLLHRLNAGDKAGAAEHFLDWTRSKGVELAGLKARREAERAIFLTGQYPDAPPEVGHTGQAMRREHTVAKGAMGDDVATLQRQLAAAGYPVEVDKAFGQGTDDAVRAFQAARGLSVDGVVGLKTWMALDGAQPAGAAPPAVSASVPTAPPAHIDTVEPPGKPSFWASFVAAFTPKPRS